MRRTLLCICPLLFTLMSNWTQTNHATDLREAYEIAYAEAQQWDMAAKPYFITSVDDPAESDNIKGEDGKRNCWNFDFAVSGTNKHLILTLRDRVIVNRVEAVSEVDPAYIIDIEDLRICTADAVAVAIDAYGLQPGTDWAQGYHFVLENDGSALVLSVVGLDAEGNMLRICFDAKIPPPCSCTRVGVPLFYFRINGCIKE